MDPVTNDDIVLLLDGKTREECLEIALLQILGAFDSPIARLKLGGRAYTDAIRIARYVLAEPVCCINPTHEEVGTS